MKTTVAPVSPIQDFGVYPSRPLIGPDTIPAPPVSPHQNADLRLVIEEDQVSGTFIYKTLDRRTGEVVKQLPREEVVRLKETRDYEPGDVIDSLT
jgi:flagellar protein FlaG